MEFGKLFLCCSAAVLLIKETPKMAEPKRSRPGTSAAQNEDLSNVEFETSEDVEVIPTFDNMGLRDELLRGIYAYGMFSSAL